MPQSDTGSTIAIPASQYDFEQFTAIYNQARADYIVPMPMTADRMAEYIHNYDIDLDASVVSINKANEATGIAMLGVRGDRAWITRLGVMPQWRGHRIGHFLIDYLVTQASQRKCCIVQLEVISGNVPAHQLFQRFGFVDVRELIIGHRLAGSPANSLADSSAIYEHDGSATFTALDVQGILHCLIQREAGASWVEENASLLNAGSLHGLTIALPSGDSGWVIYQRTESQLSHFVFTPGISSEATASLLYIIHNEYPLLNSTIENIPATHPAWPVFKQMGYVEAFRRIEMILTLM